MHHLKFYTNLVSSEPLHLAREVPAFAYSAPLIKFLNCIMICGVWRVLMLLCTLFCGVLFISRILLHWLYEWCHFLRECLHFPIDIESVFKNWKTSMSLHFGQSQWTKFRTETADSNYWREIPEHLIWKLLSQRLHFKNFYFEEIVFLQIPQDFVGVHIKQFNIVILIRTL